MRHFILITGASTGIGESSCKILAESGYDVLACVRNDADANRLVDSLGSRIRPLIMDVTDELSILNARNKAEGLLGEDPLVAIVNNAGIAISGAVLYVPVEEWKRQLDVNVLGVIRSIQAFFPLLKTIKHPSDNHSRRIINISSVSGLFASPFVGPYASSKYALEALSDSLRRELYMYDIQVVLIEPGNIITPLWEKVRETSSFSGPEYDSIVTFKDRVIENNLLESLPAEKVAYRILNCI